MKHLKKFNEMLDPMGKWSPEDETSNKIEWFNRSDNRGSSNAFTEIKSIMSKIIFDDQSFDDHSTKNNISILDEVDENGGLDEIENSIKEIFDDHSIHIPQAVEELIRDIDNIIGLSNKNEKDLKMELTRFLNTVLDK